MKKPIYPPEKNHMTQYYQESDVVNLFLGIFFSVPKVLAFSGLPFSSF